MGYACNAWKTWAQHHDQHRHQHRHRGDNAVWPRSQLVASWCWHMRLRTGRTQRLLDAAPIKKALTLGTTHVFLLGSIDSGRGAQLGTARPRPRPRHLPVPVFANGPSRPLPPRARARACVQSKTEYSSVTPTAYCCLAQKKAAAPPATYTNTLFLNLRKKKKNAIL